MAIVNPLLCGLQASTSVAICRAALFDGPGPAAWKQFADGALKARTKIRTGEKEGASAEQQASYLKSLQAAGDKEIAYVEDSARDDVCTLGRGQPPIDLVALHASGGRVARASDTCGANYPCARA